MHRWSVADDSTSAPKPSYKLAVPGPPFRPARILGRPMHRQASQRMWYYV